MSLSIDPITATQYECVYDTFRRCVDRWPDRVAIEGEAIVTYRALDALVAERISALEAFGVRRGHVVGILGKSSARLVADMLAVLAGGAVMVTIDGDLPKARQRVMLDEAGACAVIDGDDLQRYDGGHVRPLTAIDGAYIFFTSGTTGTPKAVLGTHNALGHFLHWQRGMFDIGPDDRCAQLIGLSFDPVLRDVFLPLTSGASLHIPDADHNARSNRVLEWLAAKQITVVHTLPSLVRFWSRTPESKLSHLKWLFVSGEPLTGALVRHWREHVSHTCRVINLYGPTETTMVKCWHEVPPDCGPGPVPIGRPLPECEVWVLRADRTRCGAGEPGELAIRTPHRTLGYLNAPREQRAHFIPTPGSLDTQDLLYLTGDRGVQQAHGVFEISGRIDDEIKVRGVRINPREIEALLERHPSVAHCAIFAHKGTDEEATLTAVMVLRAAHNPDVADLRGYLAAALPDTLVPSRLIAVDRIPLTANGKTDRSTLPACAATGQLLSCDFAPPTTPTELQVARLWGEVLPEITHGIGADDDFFSIGGDSIRAVRLLGRVEREFGVVLPIIILLETRTIRGLAREIDHRRHRSADTPVVLIQQGNLPHPVFCVHPVGGEVLCYRNLALRLGADYTVYGLQARADVIVRERPTVEQLASEYVNAVRVVEPHGPYHLVGFSFGGALVYEMARQLQQVGQAIHLLAIVDTDAPGYSSSRPWKPTVVEICLRLWFWLWDDVRTDGLSETGSRVWRKLRLAFTGLQRGLGTVSVTAGYDALSDRVMELKFPGYRAELVRALGTAQQRYSPHPYPGRITLIRARAQALRAAPAEDGWRAVAAGGVEVVVVPGSHFRLLQNRRAIDAIADALRARLRGVPADLTRSASVPFQVPTAHDLVR